MVSPTAKIHRSRKAGVKLEKVPVTIASSGSLAKLLLFVPLTLYFYFVRGKNATTSRCNNDFINGNLSIFFDSFEIFTFLVNRLKHGLLCWCE